MAEHVASVLLQQSDQIASSSPIGAGASSRKFAARVSGLATEQVFELARPTGFGPATCCLEGAFEQTRNVAWRRPMRRLAGRIIGACRSASLGVDRKSTRLNSSHPSISYAVFCLK